MVNWLRNAWNNGDTYLWAMVVIGLLAVAGFILAFTVPIR